MMTAGLCPMCCSQNSFRDLRDGSRTDLTRLKTLWKPKHTVYKQTDGQFERRTSAKMKVRGLQIWGLLLTLLGWIFVACSMAMEGWKVTSVGGQAGSSIITVGWYWSSLWRACYTDSAATSNCYDFPVLWAVEGADITKHSHIDTVQNVQRQYRICCFEGFKGLKNSQTDNNRFFGFFCWMFRLPPDCKSSADVWHGCRSAGVHPELCRNGVHLHWRQRQREEPIHVHGKLLSRLKWYISSS